MNANAKLVLCLVATLGVSSAAAQSIAAQPATAIQSSASSSPVAYVYVSGLRGSNAVIHAYRAASNGALTPVPGTPFNGNVTSMAVNGKYLFGIGTNLADIYSFSIAASGALKQTATTYALKYSYGYNDIIDSALLDHTGETLYAINSYSNGAGTDVYQSYRIDKGTGELTYLGHSNPVPLASSLSFVGNNNFAFGATCDPFPSPPGPVLQIDGYQRHSNGMLDLLNTNAPFPPPKAGYNSCPYLAAADHANDLAISVQATQDGSLYFQPQLATYTADHAGNLTTASTQKNMPATAVQVVHDLKMSPSGKLLAVSGEGGLQIFHFNGSNPITHYTGLLTQLEIGPVFWDNSNHLYALALLSGKLFVFTVTPTTVSQAPGSPYSISNPLSLIVQPNTPEP